MRISDWISDVCSSDLDRPSERQGPHKPRSGGPADQLPWTRSGGNVYAIALDDDARRRGRARRGRTAGGAGRRTAGDHHQGGRQLQQPAADQGGDRKSVVQGKSVSVRVVLGGRRSSKKKNRNYSSLRTA